MKKSIIAVLAVSIFVMSCKKDKEIPPTTETGPQLTFKVDFDETLPRLGNFGQDVSVGAGNAAQHPNMKSVSLHYIELAPDSLTALGNGQIMYKGPETTAGGANAVNIEEAIFAGPGQTFVSVNLADLAPGTYEWIRVSLTYQNYEIDYYYNQSPLTNMNLTGNLASYVGFNNYITSHVVKDSNVVVNSNKLQGYWAFEWGLEYLGGTYGGVSQGDGAGVTVVNPISSTSPVPAGSCVVTGKLATPLVITGNETSDKSIMLAFSINNSFEWNEINVDGKYEPSVGETVVDMGLRGLHPYVE
jgi:hypothetical protein